MTNDRIKARVLGYLQARLDRCRPGEDPRPVRAVALARVLGICPHSSRETRRRQVRRIVKSLRDDGIPIVTAGDGYWLGTMSSDFVTYEQLRHRSGLTHLAAESASKRSDAAFAARGQLALFEA